MTNFTAVALADQYLMMFQKLIINPAKKRECEAVAAKILLNKSRYETVAQHLGRVPWQMVGVIHAMEAGLNFNKHLHNGDPLTARTKNIPVGRPLLGNPPFTWEESATDALIIKGFDEVFKWELEMQLYQLERYNGFGYRRKGINTPYLWSYTNFYTTGKFVADGKFDADAVSKQPGAAALLKILQS